MYIIQMRPAGAMPGEAQTPSDTINVGSEIKENTLKNTAFIGRYTRNIIFGKECFSVEKI